MHRTLTVRLPDLLAVGCTLSTNLSAPLTTVYWPEAWCDRLVGRCASTTGIDILQVSLDGSTDFGQPLLDLLREHRVPHWLTYEQEAAKAKPPMRRAVTAQAEDLINAGFELDYRSPGTRLRVKLRDAGYWVCSNEPDQFSFTFTDPLSFPIENEFTKYEVPHTVEYLAAETESEQGKDKVIAVRLMVSPGVTTDCTTNLVIGPRGLVLTYHVLSVYESGQVQTLWQDYGTYGSGTLTKALATAARYACDQKVPIEIRE